ncbi:hypothetical protein [Geomonas subterranea]|uniref:hypothetical protein n=1 Tax=Geomonas subterranea TaxID=2847989 RepID=UPI001CD21E58|nr:hypothetical protein [Geomonas fuzhouensis]
MQTIISTPAPELHFRIDVFLEYVGTLRRHVGHRIICVMEDGKPVVRCADCDQTIASGSLYPHVLECVSRHVGHELKCEERGIEVYVTCACGEDVVASIPF